MPAQPSPEAQDDYSSLLNALIPFAEEMLKKNGEFFPFGAAVSTAGEVSAHAIDDDDEMPESEEVIASLVQEFQTEARAGKIRATGICYDGRIVQEGKKVDAVIIGLEHVTGSGSKTYVPYTKGLFGGYRFGEMIITFDEQKIFATA
ncbi:MAG: hypothetical protein JWM68_4503 [Verrucomicrobiales bacterium]|nr:hypothetical protein [Verrucomicrobiales bacterium]